MKKSLESIIRKLGSTSLEDSIDRIETLSEDLALQVRGGDREYVPIYESKIEMEWGKTSMLIDSMK